MGRKLQALSSQPFLFTLGGVGISAVASLLGVLVLLGSSSVSVARRHRQPIIHFHQDTNTSHPQQTDFVPEHPDTRGYVQNCGPTGPKYFNISWTPLKIDPTEQVYVNGEIISPIDFDRGRVNMSLKYMGQEMLTLDQEFKCTEGLNVLPNRGIKLFCPIKKGQRLIGYYVYPDTERLIGYDGWYKFRAELRSPKGELLLCIQVDAFVLEFGL